MINSSATQSSSSCDYYLNIGIVAPNFPPMVGGMEQHAYGLCQEFSKTDNVTVFTHKRNFKAVEFSTFPVKPILTGAIWEDQKSLLSQKNIELWVTLNAGYSKLACILPEPVYVYCHGNDFLKPWIKQSKLHTNLLKNLNHTPYLWRFTPKFSKVFDHKHLAKGFSKAHAIFANSDYTKKTLLQSFPHIGKPIFVSNPGVNDHFYKNRSSVMSNESHPEIDKLNLLTIARLSTSAPNKNVENVIRAIALIRHEIPVAYKIIGNGDRRLELKKLVDHLGLSKAVSFVGEIPNNELPYHLDQADLFVLVTKGLESFGIVYAEAAARGVPSLMSKLGGATDAVKEGESGIIIDGIEPKDIANGIKKFWHSRESFSLDVIRNFADQFRWTVIVDQMRQKIIETLPT